MSSQGGAKTSSRSHSCLGCRQSHARCDGNAPVPCTRCSSRGQLCAYPQPMRSPKSVPEGELDYSDDVDTFSGLHVTLIVDRFFGEHSSVVRLLDLPSARFVVASVSREGDQVPRSRRRLYYSLLAVGLHHVSGDLPQCSSLSDHFVRKVLDDTPIQPASPHGIAEITFSHLLIAHLHYCQGDIVSSYESSRLGFLRLHKMSWFPPYYHAKFQMLCYFLSTMLLRIVKSLRRESEPYDFPAPFMDVLTHIDEVFSELIAAITSLTPKVFALRYSAFVPTQILAIELRIRMNLMIIWHAKETSSMDYSGSEEIDDEEEENNPMDHVIENFRILCLLRRVLLELDPNEPSTQALLVNVHALLGECLALADLGSSREPDDWYRQCFSTINLPRFRLSPFNGHILFHLVSHYVNLNEEPIAVHLLRLISSESNRCHLHVPIYLMLRKLYGSMEGLAIGFQERILNNAVVRWEQMRAVMWKGEANSQGRRKRMVEMQAPSARSGPLDWSCTLVSRLFPQ